MAWQKAPGWLAEGERVYAIGDVHGCAARLKALHGQVAADLAARPVARPLLLHIGDYLDKGEDGPAVLDILLAGPPSPGLPVVNLRGNHEWLAMAAIEGHGGAVADWLHARGRPTLAAWGLDEDRPGSWAAEVPAAHLALLRDGLVNSHRVGGYLFVHAGIRPGVPLAAQTEEDLLSIRASFLYSEADHGFVVVHGHTAKPAVELRANRINIDTTAWSGGPLTCLVLEEDRMGFLEG